MLSTTFVAIALGALPSVFASYSVANGTATSVVYPTSTESAASSTQTVAVGKDGLTFTPDTIHAKTGDQIVFEFFPKNHAVVQADFNNPCHPSADGHGIFSGFVPSPAGRAVSLHIPCSTKEKKLTAM
jgi:plastocyanin